MMASWSFHLTGIGQSLVACSLTYEHDERVRMNRMSVDYGSNRNGCSFLSNFKMSFDLQIVASKKFMLITRSS